MGQGYITHGFSPFRIIQSNGCKWICYVSIWIALCVGNSYCYFDREQLDYYGECNKYLYSETIEPQLHRLTEIHIRHNFPGYVEIKDGPYSSKKVRIEVEKTGPSELEIEGILTNHTLFDVGQGKIFVLQLDHVKQTSRTVTIVIGAAIAGAIFLTLTSLLIWWYYRKHNQPFSPMHGQSLTAGSREDREDTYEEELVESSVTTPVHRVNGGTQGTQSCPPPPPPCRGDPTYMSSAEVVSGQTSLGSPQTTRTTVGSPRGLPKSTVVSLSVLAVLSVVYAACPFDAQARVIIVIPPLIKLESIKVFFNRQFQNEVYSDGWQHKNGSQIHIFDLEDASPTSNPPCRGDCPNAYIQNLAGCDAKTGECVCQHGYDLMEGVCIDVNECSSSLHHCPLTATCQNTIGGYICQCGYGFFGDRKTCKTCSTGCPTGYYEAGPCTNFGDRVCKECTKCQGAQYEARPCGETTDRQCMHVAHPLLIAGEETTPVFLDELKVEASDNVFLEDLHNMLNLETIYYVTDTAQAYDFHWYRSSGLRVNIGVSEIHLIPEYEDVDHESDNDYMLNNPNNSEDKTKFRNINEHYCRNPIPDYYSVTLEISRDRTTIAQEVTCDSKNPAIPQCPENYVDGDKYLHRTLNDACIHMGTFPQKFDDNAANTFVCTEHTGLLQDIFNQSYAIERPIRFPGRRCKQAQARCDQCLDQPRCRSYELFEQKCCQIDCYTLPDCKTAQSEECTTSPVECAMGDAYRYTIQPVFQNIKQHFMCHIKRREPQILYQIFYYVQIPSRNFQTPKVYKTIYAQDLEYQSSGEYRADYITVEHNTGLNLREEFILIGQEAGGEGHMNYSVHPMKEPDDYRKKRVVVHEISPNIYVASTQFERPFDYSTSSWVQANECNKNISKFQKVQKHYGTEGQSVNVNTYFDREPFSYYLKSSDPDPFLRFKVPGNMSILPYYFQDDGRELITDDTLKASLDLVADNKIWEIRIAGRMKRCDSYLGITINNRVDLEELFRYDLLIMCPPEFNLTFKMPNKGQDPDKTFDIKLQDSKKTYYIYLTQMIFEQQRIETEPEAIKMPDVPEMSITLFAIVGGVSLILLFLMLVVFIYTEHTKAKVAYNNTIKSRNHTYSSHPHYSRDVDRTTTCGSGTVLDQRQTVFIGIYIFMRIVYSLMFTFTVFFAILMLFIDKDLKQLGKLDQYQGEKYNSTFALGSQIDQYSQGELLRQGELVTSMQGACSHYIGELFDSMTKQMDNITANQHQLDMYGQDSSISYLMHTRAQKVMDSFSANLENYTEEYQKLVRRSIKPFLSRYQHYLKDVYQNDWYIFPQKLFNDSNMHLGRPRLVRNNPEFAGPEVDFGVFLEVEEVEYVQLWDIQYWEEFLNTLPDLPSLPVPKVDHQKPSCHLQEEHTISGSGGLSNHTSLDHLSSTQFISTHIASDEPMEKGPKYRGNHFAEEYKFMAKDKQRSGPGMIFSVEEFVLSINIELLRILFLIMDGILLVYRFSHTYINSTMLCSGFEDSVQDQVKEEKEGSYAMPSTAGPPMANAAVALPPPPPSQQTYATLQSRTSQYPEEGAYVETSLPDYNVPLNGQRTAYVHPVTQVTYDPNLIDPGFSQKRPKPHYSAPTSCRSKDHNFEVLKQSVVKLVLSETLPKVLVATALMVLFYLFIKAATFYLDVVVISNLEGFSVFLGALDIQVNQTNWYLMDQASHFNDVTMKIYESQMSSELSNLKSMVDYFNSEQHRLVANYISESCAITKQRQVNWTCGIEMEPPYLQVPMLPCNFVPIQPDLYTGFNTQSYEGQLGQSFEPYVNAARNVILKTGYAILIVVSAMLVIHVAGAVLFHYLKTRHKFPVRKVFITSMPPGGQIGIQNPIQGDESEYDTDDIDGATAGGAYATYATPTRVRMSSPQKSSTLSQDFKYSETKV